MLVLLFLCSILLLLYIPCCLTTRYCGGEPHYLPAVVPPPSQAHDCCCCLVTPCLPYCLHYSTVLICYPHVVTDAYLSHYHSTHFLMLVPLPFVTLPLPFVPLLYYIPTGGGGTMPLRLHCCRYLRCCCLFALLPTPRLTCPPVPLPHPICWCLPLLFPSLPYGATHLDGTVPCSYVVTLRCLIYCRYAHVTYCRITYLRTFEFSLPAVYLLPDAPCLLHAVVYR